MTATPPPRTTKPNVKPMNALELQLRYPLGDMLPEAGKKIQVAEGVYWLRMPLPFQLDHINLWLLRDALEGREGWTIVDCGITNDTTRALWEQVFAHELEGLPVLRVIVTHMHPDHIGLADWLCTHWQVRLWMSLSDYALAKVLSEGDTAGSNAGGEGAAQHFARHGLAAGDELEKIRARGSYYASMVPRVPDRYWRLLDGDTVQVAQSTWQVITGYGHAPEHVSLYNAQQGVLISGDMVLPRISTNVSVFDMEPEGDPLKLYLDSLDKFSHLPDDTVVLPSHGRPFQGLQTRLGQLRTHHQERLAETLAACSEAPVTAREIVQVMFKREFDVHQLTFAMGEALAHLHTLWHAGKVQRRVGADGVIRFGV